LIASNPSPTRPATATTTISVGWTKRFTMPS